jgi:hypothetical protein
MSSVFFCSTISPSELNHQGLEKKNGTYLTAVLSFAVFCATSSVAVSMLVC